MKEAIAETIRIAGKRILTREVLNFIVVGIISAAMEYGLLVLNVEVFNMYYLYANLVAFVGTNIVTYILSRRFVFGASGNKTAIEATLFFLCLAGGLAINEMVLWTLVSFAGTDYMIAKVPAIAITILWNFFTRKHLVFRNRQVSAEAATPDSEEDL